MHPHPIASFLLACSGMRTLQGRRRAALRMPPPLRPARPARSRAQGDATESRDGPGPLRRPELAVADHLSQLALDCAQHSLAVSSRTSLETSASGFRASVPIPTARRRRADSALRGSPGDRALRKACRSLRDYRVEGSLARTRAGRHAVGVSSAGMGCLLLEPLEDRQFRTHRSSLPAPGRRNRSKVLGAAGEARRWLPSVSGFDFDGRSPDGRPQRDERAGHRPGS
jgi:hypothetical protein